MQAEEDDGALVAATAAGDRAALARLYDRYGSAMLAVGQRVLGNRREAEDLLHDVFLEVWRQAGTYDRSRGTVRTWLLLRMRSRAVDRQRAAGPRLRAEGALPYQIAPSGDEDPALGPDRKRVRRALESLPLEQRAVLELGYFEGLSSSEIAARVSIPIGTVKSRVATALSRLRADLGPRGSEGGLP